MFAQKRLSASSSASSRIILVGAAVCAALCLASAVYALWAATVQSKSSISISAAAIEICQTMFDEHGEEVPAPETCQLNGADNTVTRILRLQNNGTCELYAEVVVSFVWRAADGSIANAGADIDVAIEAGPWQLLEGGPWQQEEWGLLWPRPLAVGETTDAILLSVQVPEEALAAHRGAQLEMNIEAHAVQSEHTAAAFLQEQGWL